MKKILPELLLICLILTMFTGCMNDTTPEGVFRIIKKAAEKEDKITFDKYYNYSSDNQKKHFGNFGFEIVNHPALESDKAKIKKMTKTQTTRDEDAVILEVEYKYKGDKYKEKYYFHKINGQWKISRLISELFSF